MIPSMNQIGRERMLSVFADWTDRIEAGELPPAPPRPQGIERNVVITMWDWADPKAYLHDVVSTDRRNPTVNANGLLYGALELSADYVPVLDPVRTRSRQDSADGARSEHAADQSRRCRAVAVLGRGGDLDEQEQRPQPDARREGPRVAHVGRAAARESRLSARKDRRIRRRSCSRSSGPAAISRSTIRRRKKLTHISTCFGTHHLMFAEDANNTLWTSGGGQVVGWLNRKMFDETGDEEKSQGWTALIVDTNGNGKRDAYVEPNQPVDPAKDKRFGGGFYAVAPAPDGSVWGTVLGFPGAVIRLDPGANPPETALAEVYQPPVDDRTRFSPRGGDVDRNGVYWAAMASGHLASFDRRKCKGPLNGPKATGQHCPEGWTFYPEPLPQMKGVDDAGQRRRQLLHVGRPVRHVGPRREHADQHRQPVRGAARAEGRQVGRAARAVSARLLHEVDGRPHRRSEGADGRAEGCGRPSARGRRSTWRRGRARRARCSSSRSGRTRWRSRRDSRLAARDSRAVPVILRRNSAKSSARCL